VKTPYGRGARGGKKKKKKKKKRSRVKTMVFPSSGWRGSLITNIDPGSNQGYLSQ
jgi:hypothetical protein